MEWLYEIDWFTVLIYTAAIVALLTAFYLEHKDLFCPYGGISRYGNGAAYSLGKVNRHDSYHEILQKIRISSRYDEASVYWRRSIVFTVLLLFTIFILVLQRLPTAYETVVSFSIIYLFTFLFLTYYQHVVSKCATAQVNRATSLLEKYYPYRN